MPFITGKNQRGRFVSNVGAKDGANIVRYYPIMGLAEFNAAILAELGEKPGTPMSVVFKRWAITETGWKRERKR